MILLLPTGGKDKKESASGNGENNNSAHYADTESTQNMSGDENSDVNSETGETGETDGSDVEVNAAEALTSYLQDTLLPQYGAFDYGQTGTMDSYDTEWFNYSGLFCGTVLDFDGDGTEELLVVRAEPWTDQWGNEYDALMMEMYEAENLTDDTPSASTILGFTLDENNTAAITFQPANQCTEGIFLTAVPNGSGYNILCENDRVYSCFADGEIQNYWLTAYSDGEFRTVSALCQTQGGSCDFEYTGAVFDENGDVADVQVYYSEPYLYDDWESYNNLVPLYEDEGEGILAWYKDQGLNLVSGVNASDFYDYAYTSLVADDSYITILSFTNQVVANHDYQSFDFEVEGYGNFAE